jgi:Cd2+/Zn2+-exporting ATPase
MDGFEGGRGETRSLAWQVTGMDCASCAAKLEKAVARLPGVSDVRVSLMAERLSAVLEAGGSSAAQVEERIAALGFRSLRIGPPPASPLLAWHVEGMDCASCVAKVDTALRRMPGVSEVAVNRMAERLTLRLAPGRTDATAIEAALSALGYPARPVPGDGPEAATGLVDATGRFADRFGIPGREPGHVPTSASVGAVQKNAQGAATRWYSTGKARLVWLLGALVAAAYLLSLVLPGSLTYPLFLVATGVALLPFGRRALALARAGTPFSIETLMVTAAIGAVAIGAAEEAAMVVLLFAIGELLENVAAGHARAGIRALAELMPSTALRVRDDGAAVPVPAAALGVGDLVLIRPGDRVACDGSIENGESSIDESPVTGESVPVLRGAGASVMAGSINVDGVLRVRVTRAASDNTIARIIRLVEDATTSRAPTQRFIERFSAWWTPGAMAVSLLVILVPPVLLGWDWWTSTYRGLAVLLIACPCALVISVPAAMAAGLSSGARRGLLIKGGAALEKIGAARTVAFDKTGTVTEGRPRITDLLPAQGSSEGRLLALAAAVEQASSHPLARAVLAEVARRGIAIPEASAQAAIPGKAVSAMVDGHAVSVGSLRHAAETGAIPDHLVETASQLEAEGKTVVVVLADAKVQGILALRDEPRADAAAGVAALARMGIRSVMLTGDNRRTAEAIGRSLRLEAKAELLPADKLREIIALGSAGPVVMVGDGINDAPALAAASVGIAMGGGTDVALETADAALLKDRVTGVSELIRLSRATMTNVKVNVAIAVGLKGVFLATTVLGLTGLWPAILSDTGATVLVTLNALRLLCWKPDA